MKTGEYRQFFDSLGINYPKNINKTTLQKAYANYWKYSKLGENNVYHRLPLEVKGYISTFIEIPGLRMKVNDLQRSLAQFYDGSFRVTIDIIELENYGQILRKQQIALRHLRKIACKKTIKSFVR